MADREDWRRVADALKDALNNGLGWKVQTLVDRSGASRSTVNDLLAGQRSNYKPDTLEPIESTLGWPPGTFRGIARGEPVPPVRPFRDERMAALEERVAGLEARIRRLVDGLWDGPQ